MLWLKELQHFWFRLWPHCIHSYSWLHDQLVDQWWHKWLKQISVQFRVNNLANQGVNIFLVSSACPAASGVPEDGAWCGYFYFWRWELPHLHELYHQIHLIKHQWEQVYWKQRKRCCIYLTIRLPSLFASLAFYHWNLAMNNVFAHCPLSNPPHLTVPKDLTLTSTLTLIHQFVSAGQIRCVDT